MKRLLIISGSCLAVLLLLFVSTDPNNIPSFVLIVPFLLFFVFVFCLVYVFLQKQGMAGNRNKRVSALIAGVPIVLLILQSIGQLTVRDVLAIAILFAISYFYVSRLSASS